MKRHTPESVKQLVEADNDRLFAPWSVGRPDGWTTDRNTVSLVTAGNWLDEELAKVCNDVDRRTQLHKFSRLSRTYCIWLSACECINDALDGTIEQNRVAHRRWG